MKLVEKILVATDFSPEADNAVQAAAFVARQFESELLLLHVMPDGLECSPEERTQVEQTIAERLQQTADRVRESGVASVEILVREGIEFEQIDGVANEQDVNLIIIGAGGTGDGGQFYLGTTAGRLRRKAVKPVWIVKPGAATTIKKILCPVDFSGASARALMTAVHLARRFQAELTVLTVIQSLQNYYEDPSNPSVKPQGAAAQTRSLELDKFLRGFDFHGVDWRKVMRGGKPQREIVKLARESETDLLVMGSVGRTGVSRILIGGVARKVAQRLPCSIITVRSEDPVRLLIEGQVAKVNANFCAARKEHQPCGRFEHGKELLEQGFPDQALEHFRECIAEYDLCPNAWENLANAHRRLGHEQEAEECEQRAKELANLLAYGEIEADIRENHPLFRSIFGA